MSGSGTTASPYYALAFEILMTMEVAALRRMGPGVYSICGMAPPFYTQLFPQDDDGSHCSIPWQYSPMLEFFMEEAEEFFIQNPEPGAVLNSGLWVEELDNGEELPLTATARALKDSKVILIQAVREE